VSRIYFHTEHEGTAEVYGTERAHMGVWCKQTAVDALPRNPDVVMRHIRAAVKGYGMIGDPMRRNRFYDDIALMLSYGDEPVFERDGVALDNFELMLNTVLAGGTDEQCLLARLHAQCEIHAYVEGPDRAWLANLIEHGLADGVFRESLTPEIPPGVRGEPRDNGWHDVVALLRHRADEPVVTSYSVCDEFPNPNVSTWEAPADALDPDDEDGSRYELWAELSDAEKWRTGMEALRGNPNDRRELSPESLRAPFGHSVSLLDLFPADAHSAL
jgi:hypothetical protein